MDESETISKLERICEFCDKKFTSESILLKTLEELNELSQIIAKYLNKQIPIEIFLKKGKEEMADCLIMLFQLNISIGYTFELREKINKIGKKFGVE
jgi:NTP pyrophosphatase (non-canonical NTP hydrolase)